MTTEPNSSSEPKPEPTPTPEQPEPSSPPQGSSNYDPTVVGIVSYITFIGWIVALIMNNPKSEYGSFHIRQSLGIMLLFVASAVTFVIPFLGMIIAPIGYLFALVLWIIGLVGAAQGKTSPIPIIGEKCQEWFEAL